MTIYDIPYVARYLLEKHGLAEQGWKFAWDNAKRRAGQCRYQTKTITLSQHYVALNVAERLDDIIDTILHEIAHALAGPGTSHGPEWKAACGRIGARPEQCYNSDVVTMPRGRHTATCGGCGKVFHHHKEPKHNCWRYCKVCGPERGRLTYNLVITTLSSALVPKRLRGQ